MANHHHHDLRSAAAAAAAAAATAYPDTRHHNDYLGYCDPAAVNLWRMVVPRGGPVPGPDAVPSHQPAPPAGVNVGDPHWAGYGPWSSMPAPPTSRHHHHHQQGVKRHFNESDDCDDAFSEESSKDQ